MASGTPTLQLTNEEYEERRLFLEALKRLSKTEQAKLFELLRAGKEEYSENSNGIFFDVAKLSKQTFEALQTYMQYCATIQKEQAEREEKTKQIYDLLR